MRTSVERRFAAGDPVHEYWLAHAEDFRVESPRGHVVGHVAEVVLTPTADHAESLVVRRAGAARLLPPKVVACEEIVAAIPARETLVLAAEPEQPPRQRTRRHRGRRVAAAFAAWLIAAAQTLGRGLAIVAVWTARAIERATIWARTELAPAVQAVRLRIAAELAARRRPPPS